MKKTKFLVLPLMSLLLTSCATSIKGSDMPKLTKDPGELIKLTMSSSISGDKDIISMMGSEVSSQEISIEVYTNFAKLSVKAKEGDESVSELTYVMLKEGVTYVLTEKDGKKSKTEIPDPTGIGFKAGLIPVFTVTAPFVMAAQGLYAQMSSITGEEEDDISLKRSGNVYTLSFTEESKDYETQNVGKITIKNEFFSGFEMSSTIIKDGKKATNKAKVSFTYAESTPSYSLSKMPDPAKYA